MGKTLIILVIGLIWMSCGFLPNKAQAITINDVHFATENYPPYNFEQNGEAKGISVDILNLMLREF